MDALVEQLTKHHWAARRPKERFWFWMVDAKNNTTLAEIANAVSVEFGVRVQDMKADRRLPKYVLARHTAWYLARQLTYYSFPTIAATFRRDHSTIILGCLRMEERISCDPSLAKRVAALEAGFQ